MFLERENVVCRYVISVLISERIASIQRYSVRSWRLGFVLVSWAANMTVIGSSVQLYLDVL